MPEKGTVMVLTVCPRSSDPFYLVAYYMKWITTSCTYSILVLKSMHVEEKQFFSGEKKSDL